jgi:hypothetical protein
MNVLKPGIDFKLPEQKQEKVIEEQTAKRVSDPFQLAISGVAAIKEQAAALGWQDDQLEQLIKIMTAYYPCKIGHICRQSIEIEMMHNDGSIRGSNRFYNMRVGQPWIKHSEEV